MSKYHKVRHGKSIEEVLVQRKFDDSRLTTLPDGRPYGHNNKLSTSGSAGMRGKLAVSSSLPQLSRTGGPSSAQDNDPSLRRIGSADARRIGVGSAESKMGSSSRVNIREIQPDGSRRVGEATSASHDYLAGYSDEDKTKMMESLIKYTRALQTRVEELEAQGGSPSGVGMGGTAYIAQTQQQRAAMMAAMMHGQQKHSGTAGIDPSSFSGDYMGHNGRQLPIDMHRGHMGTIQPEMVDRLAEIAASIMGGGAGAAGGMGSIGGGHRGGRSPSITAAQQLQLAQAQRQQQQAFQQQLGETRGHHSGTSRSSWGGGGMVDQFGAVQVGRVVHEMDATVTHLRELYRQGDPLAERRSAATLIGATVRGYLARVRLSRYYRRGAREWRWIRCRPITFLLDVLLASQSKRDAGFHLLKMNRNMKYLTDFFSKWAAVCRQNAPVRRAMRRAADERIEQKRMQLLRIVFRGLHAASIGTLSTRNANAERRKLIDNIRQELSAELKARGLLGLVQEVDVTRALHRRVLEQFLFKKRLLHMKANFNALVAVVQRARLNERRAQQHRFRQLVGRCFYEWSNHTYLIAVGLDRKRWPGPRKYEVKYNQKRVDNFSRWRCLRRVFRAWKGYYAIQYKVARAYQRKIAAFVQKVFRAWAAVAHRQHRLRRGAYENWRDFPKVAMQKPFNAWAAYVKGRKNHHNEQLRIARAYLRWKWRQKVLVIMKRWRHQAIYGRIDGLYSRQMLLKTLGEQKIFCNDLEKLMGDQTLELEECKLTVSREIEKRKRLEEELAYAVNDKTRAKMRIHHFEQELRRVESIVEAMCEINPRLLQHIQKKQEEFKFKDRHIELPPEKKRGARATEGSVSAVEAARTTAKKMGILAPGDSVSVREDADAEAEAEEAGDRFEGDTPHAEAEQGGAAAGNGGGDDMSSLGTLNKGDSLLSALHEGDEQSLGSAASHSPRPQPGLELEPGSEKREDAGGGEEEEEEEEDADGLGGSIAEIAASGRAQAATAAAGDDGRRSSHLASPARNPSFVITEQKSSKPRVHRRGSANSPLRSKLMAVEDRLRHQGDTDAASTDSGADKQRAGAAEAAAGSGSGAQVVSEEDLQLLQRVKWLLGQYRDAKLHEQEQQHHQTSLELVSFPILKELPGEDTSSVSGSDKHVPRTDESAASAASGNTLAELTAAALSKFPLKERPPLLPEPEKNPLASAARADEQRLQQQQLLGKQQQQQQQPPIGSAGVLASNSFDGAGSSSPLMRMMGGAVGRSQSGILGRPFRAGSISGGAATRHNSDASVFLEEIYDLPTQQAEEIDSLKNAAVKILLTFVEFIDSGNITAFQPTDKRLWAKYLLSLADEQKTAASRELAREACALADLPVPRHQLEAAVADAQAQAADELEVEQGEGGGERKHAGEGEDQGEDEGIDAENSRPGTAVQEEQGEEMPLLQRETTMVRLDSTSALLGVDHGEGGVTSWRNRLMQLRTLYPGAGNTSGKGVPLEAEHELSMFNRILHMRSNLEGIIQQQTVKYQRHLQNLLGPEGAGGAAGVASMRHSLSQSNDGGMGGMGGMGGDAGLPLGQNIYASNLKRMRDEPLDEILDPSAASSAINTGVNSGPQAATTATTAAAGANHGGSTVNTGGSSAATSLTPTK